MYHLLISHHLLKKILAKGERELFRFEGSLKSCISSLISCFRQGMAEREEVQQTGLVGQGMTERGGAADGVGRRCLAVRN